MDGLLLVLFGQTSISGEYKPPEAQGSGFWRSIWVVQKSIGPFWLQIMLRHLICRGTKRDPNLGNYPYICRVSYLHGSFKDQNGVFNRHCPGNQTPPHPINDDSLMEPRCHHGNICTRGKVS